MRATSLLLSLLFVCLFSAPFAFAQTPYGQLGDSATQYQHRWTDELEFAMLHQQMQQQQQQQTRSSFLTQQGPASPATDRITDARQPHAFTPIPAIANGQQQTAAAGRDTDPPRIAIPLANVVVNSVTPSDADFTTAGADTPSELDTQGFPINETIIRRARAACSLSCNERLMDVTGEGRVRINSSRATIRATIEYKEQLKVALLASSATAATLHGLLLSASNQTAATAATVINYLQSEDSDGRVWQLHTTSMLVEPIYQFVNGTQLTNGYRASLSFSLQAATANASAVLTAILERGVTRIDSVGYEAAEADTATARQKAIKRAVDDALQQAATAVQAMQQQLRKLHQLPAEHHKPKDSRGSEPADLQVISMRVTGLSVPTATVFYPSQTRIFGVSRSTSQLFVDEAVMSIPFVGEEKTVTATVLMKIRF